MRFKRLLLKAQFNSPEVHAYLRGCALDLHRFSLHRFEKPMIVTSVLREPAKQVALCKKGKFKSYFQHCVGEALDLRTWHLKPDEIDELLEYCRINWSTLCYLKHHALGTAPHMHLALRSELSNKNKIWEMVKNTEDGQDYFVG